MIGVLKDCYTFLVPHLPQLAVKSIEQIYLASIAMLFAIIIGIQLGILITNKQKLRNLVLGIASILQTIPSLAALIFLLPFFGIGAKPAIITLSLYALLPIIRNTVTGLENVPAATLQAAKGLGFTKWQRLWIVELPLALPTIVAGIRIATSISVGIATLAAFIGAGGLGDFINRGLALNNNKLLLLGAIPAALLALLLDFSIGQLEKALAKNKLFNRKKAWITITALIFLLSLLTFAVFKPVFTPSNDAKNIVRIATKNFTEQIILGEIIAQLIEAKTNLKVERYFNLGTTDICHHALISGQIDIYPEYTGTAYLTILHRNYHHLNASLLYKEIKAEYLKVYNVLWLAPLGFNNSQALAIQSKLAIKNHIKTISDLAPFSRHFIIGAPPEFIQRSDALPALTRIYNLHFQDIKQLEPALIYSALKQHDIDLVMAFSTDGRISQYNLVLLQDNKKIFPPYDAVPLIRADIVKLHPELIKVLAALTDKIDNSTMQQMNYQVDMLKRTPSEVAREFLISKGLF